MNSNEKIYIVNKIRDIMRHTTDSKIIAELNALISTIYSMYD